MNVGCKCLFFSNDDTRMSQENMSGKQDDEYENESDVGNQDGDSFTARGEGGELYSCSCSTSGMATNKKHYSDDVDGRGNDDFIDLSNPHEVQRFQKEQIQEDQQKENRMTFYSLPENTSHVTQNLQTFLNFENNEHNQELVTSIVNAATNDIRDHIQKNGKISIGEARTIIGNYINDNKDQLMNMLPGPLKDSKLINKIVGVLFPNTSQSGESGENVETRESQEGDADAQKADANEQDPEEQGENENINQNTQDTSEQEQDTSSNSTNEDISHNNTQDKGDNVQGNTKGGAVKRKVLILSRWRTVRKIGRSNYVNLKGRLIKLAQARLIEKRVLTRASPSRKM